MGALIYKTSMTAELRGEANTKGSQTNGLLQVLDGQQQPLDYNQAQVLETKTTEDGLLV